MEIIDLFVFVMLYLFAHSLKVIAVPMHDRYEGYETGAYVPPLSAREPIKSVYYEKNSNEAVETQTTPTDYTVWKEATDSSTHDTSTLATLLPTISTSTIATLVPAVPTLAKPGSLFCQNGDVKRSDLNCKEKFYYCLAGVWTETLCETGIAPWVANNGIKFPGVPEFNKTTLDRVCCHENTIKKRSLLNESDAIISKECSTGSVKSASSDCKQYFVCDPSGLWMLTSCPPNTLWNPMIERCDDMPQVDCNELQLASVNQTNVNGSFVQKLSQGMADIFRKFN